MKPLKPASSFVAVVGDSSASVTQVSGGIYCGNGDVIINGERVLSDAHGDYSDVLSKAERASAPKERDIQNEIRLALSEDYDLMRNNVGKVMVDGRALKYGLQVGSADLIGLRRRDGKFVAIEVKAAHGKLSPEQIAFIARINMSGGIAICARSAEDALNQLNAMM